jgi:hypothetical protein
LIPSIEFEAEQSVISELLPTLSRLAVRNEFCQRIVELGGLQFVMDVLAKYYDDKELVESSFFLIKSLAGNDDVKREVSKGNAVPLIAAALGRHKVGNLRRTFFFSLSGYFWDFFLLYKTIRRRTLG